MTNKERWKNNQIKFDFITYYYLLMDKPTEIKTAYYWQKVRHMDSQNGTENPDIDTHKLVLIKTIQWRKDNLFNN